MIDIEFKTEVCRSGYLMGFASEIVAGLTLRALYVMDVLRRLTGCHQRINATNCELTVAQVTKERVSGVEEEEHTDEHQHEVGELHLDRHLASCRIFGSGSKCDASFPEAVEV